MRIRSVLTHIGGLVSEEVEPLKRMKDGSARFKMVGGPYHDMVFRLYPPWDILKFPSGLTYELHPPLRKNGKWVYVHKE